ncbi:MAG: S8/S53 family peptidase [Candidatus Latescibacterota bacterium]|nr:MAG: S8/S53 family peptidase [Candidatus Latescibacterota bacterium]
MKHRASVEPRCEGIIIRVGIHERNHKKALALAKKVVQRQLRGKWVVSPLGRQSRDFEVSKAGKQKAIPVGTGWNYAYKLESDRDVVDAEPIFEMCGLEPDPDLAGEQMTPRERNIAKSLGGDKHKICSVIPDWSIKDAKINKAWEVALPSHRGGARYGRGIKVGHPDTGYTLHPEIWNNPNGWQRLRSHAGYDFVDDKQYPHDPFDKPHGGHGTKTSSVIMSDIGFEGGGPFVTGAAPEAVLVPYRVIRSVVVFNFKNVAKAIYEATDSGCHVISMSLGGPFPSKSLHRAIEYAVERGVILCAAAGNVWRWVVYPAKYEEVVGVAASNCLRKPWGDSARGSAVDISAPGESVWRAETIDDKNKQYAWKRGSGTSFAVATAAGVCALWLAYHGRSRLIERYGKKNLAPVFKELVVTKGTDTPSGWDKGRYGSGILNAKKLLEAKLPDTPVAKGMRLSAKAPSAPGDPVSELNDFFPGYGRAAVRKALAKELRTTEDELDDMLRELGEEVMFHVATNAAFRQSIQNRLMGVKAKSLRQNTRLLKHASTALRRRLKV